MMDNSKSDYITLVYAIASRHKLDVSFVFEEFGTELTKTFVAVCMVGNLMTEAEGHRKKVAKRRAAEMMLKQLEQVYPVVPMNPPRLESAVDKKKNRNLIKSMEDISLLENSESTSIEQPGILKHRLNAPLGASDWDASTHGVSTLSRGDTSTASTASRQHIIWSPTTDRRRVMGPPASRQHIIWSPTTGRQHFIYPPATSSASASTTPSLSTTVSALDGTSTSSPAIPILPSAISALDGTSRGVQVTPSVPSTAHAINGTMAHKTVESKLPGCVQSAITFLPISVLPSTSQNDPILITGSESELEQSLNESDLEIIDFEKPWMERTPIKLSSDEENDCDVMISGISYVNDPVNKTRCRKRELECLN